MESLIKLIKLQLISNARLNQDTKVWNQIQMQRFKAFCLVWTNCLSQQIWEFIGVELDLVLKREFIPNGLCYKCANLQKLWRPVSICSKGENIANQLSSRLGKFSRF
jgi:hypothetical protein